MAVIKGCNLWNLLQLSMHDFALVLQVKFPVVNRIHLQSNKFVMSVESKVKGD